MSDSFLTVSTDDVGIATVTFNRPPVNAMVAESYAEVGRTFRKLAEQQELRAVILRSALERTWIAGRDINEFLEMDQEKAYARAPIVRECFWSIYECPVPTIAAVNGAALGAGLLVASMCDIIVAADTAFFGLPEINVGSLGGAKHVSRLVPQHLVRAMMLTGRRVSAQELARLGVIEAIVPRLVVEETAQAFARGIAAKSPVAIRLAKEVLNRIEFMELRSGYELEQTYTAKLMGYEDAKEAARAFLERRPPVFTGR
jgi:enoyl-CoA hydratase